MLLGVVGIATSTNASRIVAQIAGDMSGGNEGHPHGIPSFWGLSAGPSVSDGKGAPCGALDYWGTVHILDNPAGPDDRATARFVANVGGDYYPKTTGPGLLNNRGIGGGKFKYVKASWRSFAMTTLTEKQLMNNPPPLTLPGASP